MLRGFLGGVVGGMVGNMLMQQQHFHGGGGYGHRAAPTYHPYSAGAPSSRSRPAGNGPPPSPEESSRALASLAPPTTQEAQVILKSVTPSQSLGAVGASDDLEQIGKDDNAEANRDYTGRIDDLIKRIQQAQNAQHSTKEGDVTEHAILEALESSIREANLIKFETFLGENWSPERLRVMILDRVQNEIGSLFDGTNRGAVTMNDLDLIIKKAAGNVYGRLFETSELLAANRSSTLFVQRLYQTHGDLVNGEVRESAEQLLSDASASGRRAAGAVAAARSQRLRSAIPRPAHHLRLPVRQCRGDQLKRIGHGEFGGNQQGRARRHPAAMRQVGVGAIDRSRRQGQAAGPDAAARHLDRRRPEGRPLDVRTRDGPALSSRRQSRVWTMRLVLRLTMTRRPLTVTAP